MKTIAMIGLGMVSVLTVAACSSEAETTSTATSIPTRSASSTPDLTPVPANTSLTFNTNMGPITVALNPAAPQTDASMVYLAKDGYFDQTSCHRLTTDKIFVVQCGDPTGTGTGNPGYTIPDENLPTSGVNNYPRGTVAMANAGPNTNGSQFFIVYQDTTLPPNYPIWGEVTAGMDIVDAVAAAGVAGGGSDGTPVQTLTIDSTSVSTPSAS